MINADLNSKKKFVFFFHLKICKLISWIWAGKFICFFFDLIQSASLLVHSS